MSREVQVRFCEGLGVKFPRSTLRNIYVGSERAGKRVMESITRFLSKRLKLKVNMEKSTVGKPWERKFLGFSVTNEQNPRRLIAPQALQKAKQKLKEKTRRKRGGSLEQIVEEVAQYLRGWLAYFGYTEMPSQLRNLEEWVRRRLRSLIWKRWKHGKRRYKALRARNVNESLARRTAGSSHGSWRISASPAMSYAFPNAYFTSLGLPDLRKKPVT